MKINVLRPMREGEGSDPRNSRRLQLSRMIGFKMSKLLLISFVLVFIGCDCVDYGCEHALSEPSLSPFFRLGCRYNTGVHDLDVGRVVCSFTCEKPSIDIILTEYLVDGWQIVKRGKTALVLKKGMMSVRIDMGGVGGEINVLVQREL